MNENAVIVISIFFAITAADLLARSWRRGRGIINWKFVIVIAIVISAIVFIRK